MFSKYRQNIKNMSVLFPTEKSIIELLTYVSRKHKTIRILFLLWDEAEAVNSLTFIFSAFNLKTNRSKMCPRIKYVLRANTKSAF